MRAKHLIIISALIITAVIIMAVSQLNNGRLSATADTRIIYYNAFEVQAKFEIFL